MGSVQRDQLRPLRRQHAYVAGQRFGRWIFNGSVSQNAYDAPGPAILAAILVLELRLNALRQNVGGVLTHRMTVGFFDGLNQRCPRLLSNQKLLVLLQDVALDLVQPDFQASFQYIKEVLSLVRVGAIAARPGRNSNQH